VGGVRLPGCHGLWPRVPGAFAAPPIHPPAQAAAWTGRGFQPRDRNAGWLGTVTVWAAPGSLATTTGMLLLPPGTEMVQFPGFPPALPVTTAVVRLPHSEIVGSQPAPGSPTRIVGKRRPSSARSAEASPVCSSCLPDHQPTRGTRALAHRGPRRDPRNVCVVLHLSRSKDFSVQICDFSLDGIPIKNLKSNI
jgi:hypothetical protein